MSRTSDRHVDELPICHRDRTKTLLAYAIEQHLTGQGQPLGRAGDGPWDVWWVCYRAQCAAADFGLDPGRAAGGCEACTIDASRLAFYAPPKHPDETPGRRCPCLLDWARSMRRPAPDIIWPGWRLTVGMVKPGSNPVTVRGLLAESHIVVAEIQRHLTPADVCRLYPDAYGPDYVARRNDYLTSTPVTVFVLLASPSAIGKAKDIKGAIRRRLGEGDALRNHLHMPDSPGEPSPISTTSRVPTRSPDSTKGMSVTEQHSVWRATGLYWHNRTPGFGLVDHSGTERTHPVLPGTSVAYRLGGQRCCIGVWLAQQHRRQSCPFGHPIPPPATRAQCGPCGAADPGRMFARNATIDDGREYGLYLA